MKDLTTKQFTHLKVLAHELKPVILLGHKGVTEAVVKETKGALLAHELIKVRLHGDDKDALESDAEDIAMQSGAALVDVIGKIAVLYKRHPDDPTIRLPKG